MRKDNFIDITIIVLTYNSKWEKLVATLNSICYQKNVNMQIIVSDDGSKNNYYDELESFFKEHKISNYFLNLNKENKGTVKNIASTFHHIQGEFVKLISPGDLLYSDTTLKDMCDSLHSSKCSIGFGKILPYNYENKIEVIPLKRNPLCQFLYDNNNYKSKDIFLDYLVANDTIIGASIIFEREVFIKYMERIRGSLIYAEDFSLRLMVFDGFKIHFMKFFVIWYEYGHGISTTNNSVWGKRLRQDLLNSDKLIKKVNMPLKPMQKKYIKLIISCEKHTQLRQVLKILYFPKTILFYLYMKIGRPQKETDYNLYFINYCMSVKK